MASEAKIGRWSRVLVVAGSVAIVVGAIDPMEGSVVILAGSATVALGTLFGRSGRATLRFWVGIFALIAIGVCALWGLSAIGGIGDGSGHSMWWGLLILPYPIGWLLAFVGLILRLIDFAKGRGRARSGQGDAMAAGGA
jgi:hypothetical protein